MTTSIVCICGHPQSDHLTTDTGWLCFPDDGHCSCDGFTPPSKRGERLVFGESRQPRKAAESAPAWPPLGDPR